jgi:hypothetical protein
MASGAMTGEPNTDEIRTLKARITQLEKNQLTHEQRLKLAILEKSPFTVWACDRNFKIVLWNAVCVHVYGVDNAAALGSDYASLFVDAIEEQQSRDDCLKIIDNGIEFRNFLAYDHDVPSRSRRTMLTNCFRVWDQERSDYIQVEIGLEISDLELRIDEHRTLREVGAARVQEQKQVSTLRKNELLTKIATICTSVTRSAEKEEDAILAFQEKLLEQNVDPHTISDLSADRHEELRKRRESCERWKSALTLRVISASSVAELDVIEQEVKRYDEHPAADEGGIEE